MKVNLIKIFYWHRQLAFFMTMWHYKTVENTDMAESLKCHGQVTRQSKQLNAHTTSYLTDLFYIVLWKCNKKTVEVIHSTILDWPTSSSPLQTVCIGTHLGTPLTWRSVTIIKLISYRQTWKFEWDFRVRTRIFFFFHHHFRQFDFFCAIFFNFEPDFEPNFGHFSPKNYLVHLLIPLIAAIDSRVSIMWNVWGTWN